MLDKSINSTDTIKKPSLSPHVTKWVGIFALCTSLLVNPSEKALGNIYMSGTENKKGNDTTELFYSEIRNKISLNINGLVKAIELKYPELINNPLIEYHSGVILDLLSWNIENNELNIKIQLSDSNLSAFGTSMKSVAYLLDLLNGKGYSDMLLDGKDHSDKDLLIEIMDDGLEHKIQRMSIKNSSD